MQYVYTPEKTLLWQVVFHVTGLLVLSSVLFLLQVQIMVS